MVVEVLVLVVEVLAGVVDDAFTLMIELCVVLVLFIGMGVASSVEYFAGGFSP